VTGVPHWLFEESYHTVGDLAETIALLLPEPDKVLESDLSLTYYMDKLLRLGKESDAVKKSFIIDSWLQMSLNEKFVFNKLITGGFRIGVSQKLMVNAIARTTDVSPSIIAHRISGNWDPATIAFDELLSTGHSDADFSKPYPFFLSYAIDDNPSVLGEAPDWQAEWKWDGIRGQIIKRNNEIYVWSRGGELMTGKFPEYDILQQRLPDGVAIDGEIITLGPANEMMPFTPLPFAALQTRIGRKNITKKQLTEAPVGFIAYDMIEFEGNDIRELPLVHRRIILENLFQEIQLPYIHLSPIISFDT